MLFNFVMILCFLFVAAIWLFGRSSGAKSSNVTPNPQMETIIIIGDMENTLIDEFNSAFPESLRIERPSGSSRYLQDYDPEYFALLKALKALSQMSYDLSVKQGALVKRCLQMNEVSAMFREDKDKVLEPHDIEIYTQHQQVMNQADIDFTSACRHLSYYEGLLERLELREASDNRDEGILAKRIEYQNEVDTYKQQHTDAFAKLDDARIFLQDFRLILLNKLIEPSDINDETLEAQLSNFDRYSELVYNP